MLKFVFQLFCIRRTVVERKKHLVFNFRSFSFSLPFHYVIGSMCIALVATTIGLASNVMNADADKMEMVYILRWHTYTNTQNQWHC